MRCKSAEIMPGVQGHQIWNFFAITLLVEDEFENTYACLSGAQMGSNHEKKLEVENLVTHSL